MESLCYAQNSDFYFKNIKIPVPYFKRLLPDYFEAVSYTHLDVYKRQGLLFYGNVTIPFVDRFPRGEIYDLLTTRPEDMKNETKNE